LKDHWLDDELPSKESLIKFHGCPSGAKARPPFQVFTAGLKSRPFKVPTCAELPQTQGGRMAEKRRQKQLHGVK
jgi:hypothetical protein